MLTIDYVRAAQDVEKCWVSLMVFVWLCLCSCFWRLAGILRFRVCLGFGGNCGGLWEVVLDRIRFVGVVYDLGRLGRIFLIFWSSVGSLCLNQLTNGLSWKNWYCSLLLMSISPFTLLFCSSLLCFLFWLIPWFCSAHQFSHLFYFPIVSADYLFFDA